MAHDLRGRIDRFLHPQQIAENELVHRGYGAFRQINEKRLFELSPDGNTRQTE